MGLDPATGAPMGYFNGQVSENYSSILSSLTKVRDLDYQGSSIPVYYGAFRNTFTWKQFSVSANIQYKMGYKFIENGIQYSGTFPATNSPSVGDGNKEYAQRWQKPGDEKFTSVPAFIYPMNAQRDQFYNASSAVVGNADNIRLQDIVLEYNTERRNHYFHALRVYATMDNVGLLWKANKWGLDPVYGTLSIPPSKAFTLGLTATF